MATLVVYCPVNPPKLNLSKIKDHPEYTDINRVLQPYIDEYVELAGKRGIKFTHDITAGMKEIKEGRIIGLCNYNEDWREIDIDIPFWNNATSVSKKTLMFHELTHCKCNRDHDYGKNKTYLVDFVQRMINLPNGGMIFWFRKPGYYPDDCPVSIMYPSLVPDQCIKQHEKDYIDEMFERCEPY